MTNTAVCNLWLSRKTASSQSYPINGSKRNGSAIASLERVSTLFDSVPEPNDDSGRAVSRIEGEIEVCDVDFS